MFFYDPTSLIFMHQFHTFDRDFLIYNPGCDNIE